jgi:serine/threonine protein kinase/class 3 adenylate cyclase
MRLGRFELLAQIGAGRDGVSYRAQAGDERERYELYDLGPARIDPNRWAELVLRLRLASRLAHPALACVRELSLDTDPPYAALQGTGELSLARHVLERGTVFRVETLRLVQSLAAGIAAAHRLGLVHGRINSCTVRIDERGLPRVDMTGAEVQTSSEDAETRVIDERFLAPEVIAGASPGRAADVHGLGVLLAWLLGRGREPDTPGHDRRPPEKTGDPIFEALLCEAAAESPDDRPSAQELAQRLAAWTKPEVDATGEWKQGVGATQGSGGSRTGETMALTGSVPIVSQGHPESLGRFQLIDLLGEGGQGAVYRARDTADGSIVALKVLRTERAGRPEVLKRFRKEARLMAEANNPQVVNLLEFNEEDGVPYLVLEFVAGKNLQDLIAERGRLDEATALDVMADVARALAGPHDRGIIHRDVKPANILLLDDRTETGAALAETVAMSAVTVSGDPRRNQHSALLPSIRVKLSDFGLARHVIDSQSLAMTEAGALLGTPHYMAPEQWNGLATDPRTDVYAIGATLFHVLAGRPPFTASTRDELLAQHCNEPVPPLRRFHGEVSEGIVRVVEKALAKQPEDRYPDASAMLRDLEALRHGTPSSIAIHPRLPECSPRDVIAFDWEWDLEASPRALWPHVSNTERVNRALGLPAPEFTARAAPEGGVERYARFHKVVPFAWREHPFEWVEGQRFGVLREFQQGVFLWFVSQVELQPRGGGGTRLIQRIRVSPRGMGGRLMAHLQLARGGRRSLERVYRRIDAAVMGKLGPLEVVDPFEEGAVLTHARRSRLDQGLDRLIQAGADPVVVERLGAFLGQAPDPEVVRIRPLALAERLGLEPEPLIAACLKGAHGGLLILLWDLLCPVCRISSGIKETLRALGDHGHCAACNLDYPLDFASSVELIFRIHPEIRPADLGTYCIGGPAHSPHVLAQVRVAAAERIELALELPAGSYRIRGPQLPWSADFQVHPSASGRLWEIDLASGPEGDDPRTLRPGHQVITLENGLERELIVRVERTALRGDALTAARASAMSLFRELFPAEVLSPGQLATISTVTLLATELDPAQADALYREQGDTRAFNVTHELFHRLQTAVREAGGAVVKTIGEGLLAAFPDPASAVRVGLGLQGRLASGELTRGLRLRTAIHHGTALAANVNEQLDYFGATARQVIRMPAQVEPGELALSPTVASDPEVAAVLHQEGLESTPINEDDSGLRYLVRIRPLAT